MPDADFKQAVIAAFVDLGKPHPTPAQIREVDALLPDHAFARPAFLESLRKAMPRIKTPGVLPGHTRGFLDAWPRILEGLEMQRTGDRRQQDRILSRAREILATPADAKDRHGNLECDDRDRQWAREMLGITEVA